MRNVSKSIFLKALDCPTAAWIARREDQTDGARTRSLTLGEQFRMEQGREIGKRARQLYPEGILVAEDTMASAAGRTEALLEDPSVVVVFEGAFLVDGYAARADILRRMDSGWHLYEVKSNVNDDEKFIDDMAYTALAMKHSGWLVTELSLLLLSKDFRLGMPHASLFAELDHTDEVLARIEELESAWQDIEESSRSPDKTPPKLHYECRECEYFSGCVGAGIENPIFDIPRLGRDRFDRLVELGVDCIESIPDSFSLTDQQAIVRDCVVAKDIYVSRGLGDGLEAIEWPAYYLDFETVMTAIPLYSEVAPYTQIATQFSMHVCSKPGEIGDHFEYLGNPSSDSRRKLAEELLRCLDNAGSILAYSSFEKRIINGLAKQYPHLEERLQAAVERIVDLAAIIRRGFYHPGFHGSYSIKRVLPVLVPELSYTNLDIQEGDAASATYALLALRRIDQATDVETARKQLLDYCRQDTLAMVRLHDRLASLSAAS